MLRRAAFVALWSLVTTIGYGFAGVGTHYPGSFPVGSGGLSSFDTGAAVLGLVIGGVGGIVIGTFQWLVLRAWLGIGWRWLAATAVAIGVTHAVGDGLPSSIEWPPVAVVGGLVMAGAQWLALRGHGGRTLLAAASGTVFALAVIVGVLVADPRSADWRTAHVVAGAVSGIAVSFAMGAVLLRSSWPLGAAGVRR